MVLKPDLSLGLTDDMLLPATLPAELRGSGRDDARLLLSDPAQGRHLHARMAALPTFLRAGDLVVLNDSKTLPAALPARRADGTAFSLHLATPWEGAPLLAEPRTADGRRPLRESAAPDAGESISIVSTRAVMGRRPFPSLRLRELEVPGGLPTLIWLMAAHGSPVRYAYVTRDLPLDAYQTSYARQPGSVEMPSAGRALSPVLLRRLRQRGVEIRPLTLHTSLSSHEVEGRLEDHVILPEPMVLTERTVRAIRRAKEEGRRVIAVGTTVVRALASAPRADGLPVAWRGYAEAVVTPDGRPPFLDGLLTGLHAPRSSHLALLEAFLDARDLRRTYLDAVEEGYLWHEFGDVHLILPGALDPTV